MNLLHAIKRCEELTYENAKLRADADKLKADVAYLRGELEKKQHKIGVLITDNGRLVKVNAYLAEALGKNPRRRRVDDNGDPIEQQ